MINNIKKSELKMKIYLKVVKQFNKNMYYPNNNTTKHYNIGIQK